jgi:hypothetical protein
MTKCSIALLSWSRPTNINIIIAEYEKYETIGEIIIWNNNSNFLISNQGLSKVKVINCEQDFGLNARFTSALLCKNRCVIVHDDDLILSEINIKALVDQFNIDHNRVYTYQGRILIEEKYNLELPGLVENVQSPTEAEIALTRATCFDRLLAAEYMKFSDILFYDTSICLDSEDIALSYLSTHIFGKKPLVLPIPDVAGYVDLASIIEEKPFAKQGFIEERNKMIDRCNIVFPSPIYENTNENKIIIFGKDKYPIGYCEDSACYNTQYQKILIKESNGIKYLSIQGVADYSHSCSYLLFKDPILINKNICFIMFFKESSVPVEIQVSYTKNKDLNESKRILLEKIEINEHEEYRINLNDLIDPMQNTGEGIRVSQLKFMVHNRNKNVELCVSEIYMEEK